ncbi:MAG: putative branched-chain amino acid transport system substrate-binding protein precursor [Frankiales bacterium]|nr:putative branched-chain amino acid transport system substrate-binding protein precursor [Frankiales bacterium]
MTETTARKAARHRPVLVLGLALCLTACGSQLSEQDIALRTAGSSGAGQAAVSEVPGGGAPVDPGAETGTGGATGGTTGATGSTGAASGGSSSGSGSTGSSTGGGAATGGSTGSTGGTGSTGSSGESAGKAGATAPSGTGSTGPAVAKDAAGGGGDILVGNVGSVSGIYGGALAPVQQAVQVWAQAVNAKGGLGGRKVKVLTADDGGDAAKHQQLVQEMVEKDKVVAFVGQPNAVSMTSRTVSYLKGKGIPIVGGDMGNTLWYTSPLLYPQAAAGGAYGTAAITLLVRRTAAAGKKKIALVACQEIAICGITFNDFDKVVKAAGGTPVYKTRTQLTNTSYTSECLGAQRAGAEVLYFVGDSNTWRRLASSCAGQNYRPIHSVGASIAVPAHAADKNLQGAYTPSNVFPWFANGSPAQKEYSAALARYLPGQAPAGGHSQGWVSGKMFEKAVASISGPVTSATLIDSLSAFKGETLGGLVAPLTFTKGKPATSRTCAADIRITGKSFTSPDNGAITCF